MLTEWIAAGSPFTAELARVKHVDYVDLPTGHWPQFTKPVQLGQAIVAALGDLTSPKAPDSPPVWGLLGELFSCIVGLNPTGSL